MAKEIIRTTCPRDCYDSCGIAVIKRDGIVRKVLGDPEHPISRGALCGKCALAYNGVWRDREARLDRPLRRDGPKGEGRFRAISWEAALAEIAEGLKRVVEARGPAAILQAHYTGTCSVIAGRFPMRFFNRLGATEVDPDTICNKAGHVALGYLYGTSVKGFDPKTAAESACIMVWGANPSASAPHAHKHWLPGSPAVKIVVDPVRHDTAAAADLHLQPFPGSDAALAFAMAHVAWREDLLDHGFIARNTLGWEELEPLLPDCTPAWAEAVTGVAAGKIEEAARLYAKGPSLLWLGQGLQRQPRGGNVMRACGMLPAVTGNLGKPGCGIYYLNAAGPRKIDGGYLDGSHLRQGPEETISHMDLAERLGDPARAGAFFCWNMNPAASGPRQAALRTSLARDDLFSVVVDLFQTDTADYADIVLPAASFLEFDDLVVPYFHLLVSAQAKVEEPPGEALPNQEIFRRLARAMGFNEPELFESDEAILAKLLAGSGLGLDFATLRERGTVDPWPDARIPFADGRYPTPSGKIELASDRAEADGFPRLPDPWADARPEGGRLRLLSPASRWQMNDSYGNEPRVREQLGDPEVTVNPADAAALGLAEGSKVVLSNPQGRLTMTVHLSEIVGPGVALSHKGRWLKHEDDRANVNLLNPGTKSDLGASSSVHGLEVEIRPAKPQRKSSTTR